MAYGKIAVTFMLSFALGSSVCAQQPEELLNRWAEKSPVEKVYLHFDRDSYIAGETAWFKAYLYADFLPDTISSVLYVELRDPSSGTIASKVLPVFLGSTNGQIELPDTLYTGEYLLSAWSPTMLNNGPGFIFQKRIFIYGKSKKEYTPVIETGKPKIEFFPEGGNLVAGLNNVIAFKISGENGFPVTGSGTISDEAGHLITAFSTYHNGMGLFELNPVANKKYFAKLENELTAIYPLPVSTGQGIVLSVIPHPMGFFFELYQNETDPAKQPAYMLGQMQHHVVFRQNLLTGKQEQKGLINTSEIRSGIMQVTVFNKDGIPLAERLCFVNNKEYRQTAGIRLDTVSFDEKGRNHFKIIMKDTIQGSLSVSITDADFELNPSRQETIISGLLLSADLKGTIHHPAWYFNAENDSVGTAIDLLMMTNGWRRFRWEELARKVKEPLPYRDPVYITISGRVNLQGTKKPFTDKQLMAIITAEGLGKSMQEVHTDKQGNFRLDSLLFFGKGRILFIDTRGKKSQYIDVVMTGDSINKRFEVEHEPFARGGEKEMVAKTKMQTDYDAIQKEAGLLLEEVKVKAVKKSPVQVLEEKYTSGMFSGNADRTVDLVNTDEYITVGNIFEHLVRIVPGLDFITDGGEYIIYYRQGPSASSMGPIPMIVYLNEVETDASVIATIPPQEIALVKVYNYFVGGSGNAAGGALSIYTRKAGDYTNSSRGDFINYRGFSVVKEFYNPDYKSDPSLLAKPDNRITLLWRPNIFVNNINPVIPVSFYNSDRAKKFRIVVEGMTTSGKLISTEAIVTPR